MEGYLIFCDELNSFEVQEKFIVWGRYFDVKKLMIMWTV